MSRGLARGLLVLADGVNITGEGMGIGAPAVQSMGYFCFARTCTTTAIRPGVTEKRFIIDSRMLWGMGDTPSPSLTRVLDRVAGVYMKWPVIQPLLAISSPARSSLGITPFFEPITPVAEAVFTYEFDGNEVEVSCTIRPCGERLASACILNELAADAFTHSFCSGKVAPPPTGWRECGPGSDLYDPVRAVRFGISGPGEDGIFPEKVFWGREHTKELRWAGFVIELQGADSMDRPRSCVYRIRFTGEPGEGDKA